MIESADKKYLHLQMEDTLGKIRVLLYHRIIKEGNARNDSTMVVQSNVFRQQLESLDRWGYSAITFQELRHILAGELSSPKNSVIITFDGGCEDIYNIAFPILQEFGMKAVVFVLGDQSIRENVWDINQSARCPLLTQQQILEMNAAGFEIGAHSMTYQKLTTLTEKKATEEILRSRILLEIFLNTSVHSFSYPYGLVNDSIKNMTKDAGYTIACANYTGPALFGRDLFEVRRILVPNSVNRLRFWWSLQAFHLFISWLFWKLNIIFLRSSQANISFDSKFHSSANKAEQEHVESQR